MYLYYTKQKCSNCLKISHEWGYVGGWEICQSCYEYWDKNLK